MPPIRVNFYIVLIRVKIEKSLSNIYPDALNTDTKLRKNLRQRAKQKEERKIARLQNPRLNTHDKDEMS